MLQKILRTALLAISILVAYLLISYAEEWILNQPKTLGPHIATLIGMAFIVFLFVPLFQWMDRFTQSIVQSVVRTSSNFFGRAGLYIFLVLMLLSLYAVYLHLWFNEWLI
ncbi:MAG: hypothetical protein NXI24_15995 [bacterium]|nr:hypothetical protein [bacterium]